MDQNFFSLEYDNCRDLTHAPMLMQWCFISVKVNFEKKIRFFSLKISFSCTSQKLMLINVTTTLLHYLSTGRLREVKNKRKFQTFSYKSGCGRLREVVAHKRFQNNLVIWLGNFWYFGKLVAEERWSLTRRWSQPEVRLYLIPWKV